MLPPLLEGLKADLQGQREKEKLSPNHEQLLKELEFISLALDNNNVQIVGFPKPDIGLYMTSGPGGVCPCCGK